MLPLKHNPKSKKGKPIKIKIDRWSEKDYLNQELGDLRKKERDWVYEGNEGKGEQILKIKKMWYFISKSLWEINYPWTDTIYGEQYNTAKGDLLGSGWKRILKF